MTESLHGAAAPRTLTRAGGATIAYHATAGKSPGVIFLPGLRSDMTGTKATALEDFCRGDGRAYVRFDYTGHGASSGAFIDGTVGAWKADALSVLDEVAEGPQVLVGSSLGGWLMLLLALARPERVAGLVGVAPAVDFAGGDLIEKAPPEMRRALEQDGVYYAPSQYADEPTPITMRLIEEGRRHHLLGRALPIACPVRILHGMADPDVPWRLSLEIAETIGSADVEVTLVKAGDHRLSEPRDIQRLIRAVKEVCALVEDS